MKRILAATYRGAKAVLSECRLEGRRADLSVWAKLLLSRILGTDTRLGRSLAQLLQTCLSEIAAPFLRGFSAQRYSARRLRRVGETCDPSSPVYGTSRCLA